MTLKNAFCEFLITQELKGNSDKTISYYKNCITPLLQFVGADLMLSDLTAEILRKYALNLKHKGISSNSFKTYLKGIKVFLNWLYLEEYTQVNLSDKLQLPRAQRKTIDTLTPQEIKALLSLFDIKNYQGLRNYCICALMLDSGLRKSEIVSLNVSDVHIFEGYILVNGKGNKQRIVPIGNNSKKHLIKYISQRPFGVSSERLFLTRTLTPITDTVISRLFKTIQTQKVRTDLLSARIHAHLLRHTFATTYLENGGNIYTLQQILGHTTLDMVKKYVHITQSKAVVNFKNYSPLDNLNT